MNVSYLSTACILLLFAWGCKNQSGEPNLSEESEPVTEASVMKQENDIAKTTNVTLKKDSIKELSTAKAENVAPKPKKRKATKPKVVKKAKMHFETISYDFGEIMEGDIINFDFRFMNAGNAPLSIKEADATCGCATPSIPFLDIAPNDTGKIGVRYNSVGKSGEQNPQITIRSNASNSTVVLNMKGTVKAKPNEK